MSAGASSKRIGRAKSSTSFTIRFRRTTSPSMSAAASRTTAGLDVRLAKRVKRRLDDHQRIADFVRDDRGQAARATRAAPLRHLALARNRIGQRVERRRQQPRVFVVPLPRAPEHDLAREVAGGGDLPHDAGDGGERTRDGPRHGKAQKRREEHRDHRRHRQLGVDRAQEAELLGPRAEDERDGPASEAGARWPRQRQRERDVFFVAERDVRRVRRRRAASASAGRPPAAAWSPGSGRPCRRRCRCRSSASAVPRTHRRAGTRR